MPKLIMCKGLPASGKSTWSQEQVEKHGWKRVSKDSLRAMLDNSKWSGKNEKFVLQLRDTIVAETLKMGKNIIVDDTNLNPAHERDLKELVKEYNAEFIVQDFTDVPLEECIKRDQKRQNYVGEKVIRGMYKDFLSPKVEEKGLNPLIFSKDLPYCFIFDIDGTLVHRTGRSPYDEDRVLEDLPNESITTLYSLLRSHEDVFGQRGYEMFIFSGRSEDCRKDTLSWLEENEIYHDGLFMRPSGDKRKDSIVKRELFDQHIKDKFNVLLIIDDRKQVVDAWRSLGITVLQCAEGNF